MDYSDRQITIWSDYLCPFCWVARPRIAWLEKLGVSLDWQPYELHPEIPREGIERSLLRGPRSGRSAQIRTLAEQENVAMDYPDFVPNTRLAHEAAEWARLQGLDAHSKLHDALFDAYWRDGRDIGKLEVICAIAGESGLDAQALRNSVESGNHFSAVDAARERGRDNGVSGTPAFLIARGGAEFLVPGLQNQQFFQRVLDRIGSR